jgi:toxin ParE1/3/4
VAKKHKYRVLPQALRDLDAIADYILDDDPSRAISFVDELWARFRQITERPLSFPSRPDLAPGLHSALHGNYLIVFLIDNEEVVIARVVHGARDIENLF